MTQRIEAIADCRKEFEKWAAKHDYGLTVIRTIPEKYYEGDTQGVWMAWQASRESATAEIERLRGENAELKAKLDIATKIAAGARATLYNDVMCMHSPELPRKSWEHLISENYEHIKHEITWEFEKGSAQ